MKSKGQDQDVSNTNYDYIGKLTRGHVYFMLAKNLSTFCPCIKTLYKAKFKDGNLVYLVEEISRYSTMQAVPGILLAAFSLVCS